MSRFFIFLLLLFFVGDLQAQSDSLETLDSLLEQQQAQKQILFNRSDSLHLVDSLAQQALLADIQALQDRDAAYKTKLQARLDSLKNAQDLRQAKVRREVDSLRAQTTGVPVVLFERDTIFTIYSKLGPFSPRERAESLQSKIESLVDQRQFKPSSLQINQTPEGTELLHEEIILFSLNDRDAFWLDESSVTLAENYREAIVQAVEDYQSNNSIWANLKRAGALLLVLLLFFFVLKYLNRAIYTFNQWVLRKGEPYLDGIRIRNYELLTKEREEQALAFVFRSLRWLLLIVVVYLVLPAVFSIFPATQGLATTLFGYVLNPLKTFFGGLLAYIPDLITIVVIALIARYFIKLLSFLSSEVEAGKLEIPGFYPDWASPTLNLLRIIVYAFTFVVIFPYLPGSGSPVFQGVSVFFGLLISLGSSSAIGNIIAGLVITYMRAFKIGDRVKIGETTGEVLEKTMLVTRVRTIKNEDVTIPNSAILNGSTINYSSSAHSLGLILNTSITIGYDVPWRQVHELLLKAAKDCEDVKAEPEPFVLQTGLEDFYVSYQINAYTDQAGKAAKIYSELHAKIQDYFNEAGVEILSPHYRAARDGNTVTIPAQYLSPDYQAPSFRVKMNEKGEKD